MDKTQLKKILKPLIKECIKEVIFEDGTLSTVVSEVVKGLGNPLTESRPSQQLSSNKLHSPRSYQKKMQLESDGAAKARRDRMEESRKKMRDVIGKDAYNGVDLFEGTTPTKAQPSGVSSKGHGALKDVAPNDPGVDISAFMGSSTDVWKKLVGK